MKPTVAGARAIAKRNEAARRTKARAKAGGGPAPQFFTPAAVRRLAELSADSPPEPRAYTLQGIAAALSCSMAKVLRLVKIGRLPAPDCMIDGNPRWRAEVIEPLLQSCGYALAALQRDLEFAKHVAGCRVGAASRLGKPQP